MQIESYSFGQMKVGGKVYTSDLLLCGDEVKANWWRAEGHLLCWDDLTWILDKEPDVLIIGTGKSGVMQVPKQVKQKIKDREIKIIVQPTAEAVETFNQYNSDPQLVAAGFHLTC